MKVVFAIYKVKINMEDRNMKIKASLLCIVVLVTSMCWCLAGCVNSDRLLDYYFLAATGYGEYNNNVLHLNEMGLINTLDGSKYSKAGKELVKEINAIPDQEETGTDLAYVIRLTYKEKGEEKTVEKIGYDSFPDNWNRIVDITNEICEKSFKISYSKEIVKITPDFLREYENVDESILPEGVTLADFIEDRGIDYLKLYDTDTRFDINKEMLAYVYEYYGLDKHQLTEIDENPAKSSYDEMKEFADSGLDMVYWEYADDVRCAGTYRGYEFEIIRYDKIQEWLSEGDKYWTTQEFVNSDGVIRYRAELRRTDGGTMVDDTADKKVFVDSSGKFIILTECDEAEVIAHVVEA